MPTLINHTCGTNPSSVDEFGMREMQRRAFDSRNSQYLLLKAPPASGKSRALMYIALDKLANQGLKKVIVAVPERTIGSSFRSTELKKFGFWDDWTVSDAFNLTTSDGERKTQALKAFLGSAERILICTHATLRFAYADLGPEAFADCLVAIDEFHHTSADAESKLGELVRGLVTDGRPHIVAMTGSYFRGDTLPVLRPEDEAQFTRVTYTYYEQLAGYEHLKMLGLGYYFHAGHYVDSIAAVLDTKKKTIIHIPSVNSAAAGDVDKNEQVGRILDCLYDNHDSSKLVTDPATGFDNITLADGRLYKVANLVDDEPRRRNKVVDALRNIQSRDDIDLIIALGMAKEGFDWVWCEHVLTVGYRSSMTEVVQIIGRTTRDAPGKTEAQFTNLISEPANDRREVTDAINDILKAISVSLVMEQVLAPNFSFRAKTAGPEDSTEDEGGSPSSSVPIEIRGFQEPSDPTVVDIVENRLDELHLAALNNNRIQEAILNPESTTPAIVNTVLLPRVIEDFFGYPAGSPENTQVLHGYLASTAFKNAVTENQGAVAQVKLIENSLPAPAGSGDQSDGETVTSEGLAVKREAENTYVKLAGKFVDLKDLSIDLIMSVSPFEHSYKILSKTVDHDMLAAIHRAVVARRIDMTDDEAARYFPMVKAFFQREKRYPNINAPNPQEQTLAQAWARIEAAKKARDRALASQR
jgi:hypothetical protein